MKKFLAIVMCLAMALSMMTVVSFAAEDIIHVGPKAAIVAEPGAEVTVPVYMYNENGSDVKIELQDWSYTFDEEIFANLEVEYGIFDEAVVSVWDDTLEVYPYSDSAMTITSNDVIFTLKFIAPAEEGEYTIATIDDSWANLSGLQADGKTIGTLENVSWDSIVIKVEAPAAGATVEATSVKSADENGQPVALYILQPKNAKACGIIYVGENAKYKNEKFASLADPSDAMAAVKVIGLDDAFEAYAE